MSSKNKRDFKNIIKNIISNNKFKDMDNELHHGLSRYGHSLRVAKVTYMCAKALNLDYKSATKAALLHDFYTNDDFQELKLNKMKNHAAIALKNAREIYDLSKKEENIIASHMYPISYVAPKYLESWLVTAVDKGVALYEIYRFKLSLVMAVWTVFLFNMITIQR